MITRCTDKFSLLVRWLKFNAVGAAGICVQLFAVYVFGSVCALDSLWATALAVESAVLHNFFWHENFTWCDRPPISRHSVLFRLVGFNATTGAVSIAGNLLFVSLFTNRLHASIVVANLCAVAACSLINFAVNDRLVFRAVKKSPTSSRNSSTLLTSH
jgi:putative flippase GtrA